MCGKYALLLQFIRYNAKCLTKICGCGVVEEFVECFFNRPIDEQVLQSLTIAAPIYIKCLIRMSEAMGYALYTRSNMFDINSYSTAIMISNGCIPLSVRYADMITTVG